MPQPEHAEVDADMTTRESVPETLTDQQRRALLRPVDLPTPRTGVLLVLVAAVIIWSASGTELSLQRLARGLPLMAEFFRDLWPPDRSYFTEMWPPIRATLQMAVMGLVLSVLLAFPAGLLAASNTAPSPAVYQSVRFLLNLVRAIPSLVWAIIVVGALGFGPFAGVLALGIAGVGTLGKLYAEAIEAINPRPVEAVRATGAGSMQVFSFAVLPQALPLMVSYTLLDFESNVRSATILGIVGAGGIGFELQASFSQFKFHEVLTILIEIMLMVTVIDRLSAIVRRRLI